MSTRHRAEQASPETLTGAAELTAYQQIVDCMTRFSLGMDRLDSDLLRSSLHEDAIYDCGAFVGTTSGLCRIISELPAHGTPSARHHLTNHSLDLGAEVAHTETYFIAQLRGDDAERQIIVGRYLDRFDRRQGSWKLAFRYCVPAWIGRISASSIPMGCHHRAPPQIPAPLLDRQTRTRQAPSALKQLLDRYGVLRSMLRYARGIDLLDRDLMLSAFHSDAVVDHGHFVGSPDGLFDVASQLNSPGRTSCHVHLTNHSCELSGDTAHAETYYIFTAHNRGEDNGAIAGGRYFDRLERRQGAWLISTRYCVIEWAGTVTGAAFPFEAVSDVHLNGTPSRGRDDPSYRRPLMNSRPPRIPDDIQAAARSLMLGV